MRERNTGACRFSLPQPLCDRRKTRVGIAASYHKDTCAPQSFQRFTETPGRDDLLTAERIQAIDQHHIHVAIQERVLKAVIKKKTSQSRESVSHELPDAVTI